MNILTAILVILFLILISWAFFKARSITKDTNKDEDDRKLALWFSRMFGIIFLVSLIAAIQVSGIIKIPDPFQGSKITNELRGFDSDYEGDLEPPELKSVPIQPDFDAVKGEHEKQLKEFEGK